MSRITNPSMANVSEHDYSYYQKALSIVSLPAAFVDLDHFNENLERLRKRAGGLPIRLVTKSIRSVEILRRVMAAGPFMCGLLCYSAAEAAWLASQGFDDIVVAYPTVELNDILAVVAQRKQGKLITLMVDDPIQVERINQIAQSEDVVIPLSIDLDMSSSFPGIYFGVRRSPINSVSAALALANRIKQCRHVLLDGVMGYEGQIAGLMDDVPGERIKNYIIRHLKKKSIREVNDRRQDVVNALIKAGFTLRFVNGGGTGSFESTRLDKSVTELAAGSGLFAPTLFDHYKAFKLLPAAGFALPVVRIPMKGITTCSGGGYIASGPISKNRLPQPWLPKGGTLIEEEGAGEVQTPVVQVLPTSLKIGDLVLFRHTKAGELCERFNHLHLIQGGRVIDTILTYRGDGKSFF